MLLPHVSDDLTLRIGASAVRLTPSQGFQLAERLIRQSTVRIIEEETAVAGSPPPVGTRAARKRPQ